MCLEQLCLSLMRDSISSAHTLIKLNRTIQLSDLFQKMRKKSEFSRVLDRHDNVNDLIEWRGKSRGMRNVAGNYFIYFSDIDLRCNIVYTRFIPHGKFMGINVCGFCINRSMMWPLVKETFGKVTTGMNIEFCEIFWFKSFVQSVRVCVWVWWQSPWRIKKIHTVKYRLLGMHMCTFKTCYPAFQPVVFSFDVSYAQHMLSIHSFDLWNLLTISISNHIHTHTHTHTLIN